MVQTLDIKSSPTLGRRATLRALSRNRFAPRTTGLSLTRSTRITSGSASVNGTSYSYNVPQYWWNSGAISMIGSTPTAVVHGSLAQGAAAAQHVNYGTIASPSYGPGFYRWRFRTAAPVIGIHTLGVGGSGISVCVDGVWTGQAMDSPVDGAGDIALQLISLGAYSTVDGVGDAPTITAAGSGYAVGNTITLTGGTGTAAIGFVTSVSGGAVTGISWLNRGAYSARPSSPISTTTSGSGTGLTVTPSWQPGEAVRDRVIELYCLPYTRLIGVSVGADYTVQPVPAMGPRFAVLGDSQSEWAGANYAGGLWWQEMCRAVGLDDQWQFAAGGTGWVAGNSFANRIPDIIAAGADIVWAPGSQNDAGQTDAAITAAVYAGFMALRDGLPNAVLIGSSPWNAPFASLSDAKNAAVLAGITQANDAGAGVAWVDTKAWTSIGRYFDGGSGDGSSSWKVGPDATHYTQLGQSDNATLAAEALRLILAAA
jgi:hypothetical protein